MDSIKKMSQFQIIVMVVCALLALVGLLVFATTSGSNGTAKIGTVTIWGTLPQAAVTQELATLTTADRSYAKVTYVQKQANTFDADLANAIASGIGPDMIIISQEQLLSEESKLTVIPFSSIPQRTFLSTFLPESQLYLTANGTYGIPYVLDPLVLYYNQTLLNQAGIANPPASWEAVTGLAPALTKSTVLQPLTQSSIAFGTYTNIENARAIISLLFLQAGSTITQASTAGIRSTLSETNSSTTGVPPVEAALNFYTQFADPSRTVYSWNSSFPSAYQAFIAGSLALYVGFASEEPVLKAANPNLSFDMAPIPQPQTSPTKIDYGLMYAFAIPKASPNPSGAFKVATALVDPKYLPATASALSIAPANRSLLNYSASDQYAPIYYPEALVATGWLSPAPGTTDSVFSAMINNVSTGRYPASTALSTAAQALDAALPSSSQ
jgi:ABC-type glycerol-3-phosphate transport system substrate-binding protein